MRILYSALFKFAQAIRYQSQFRWLYDFLDFLGIRIFVSRFFNYLDAKKTEKNPTKQMSDSTTFFESHRAEIENNLTLLADEESKIVYQKMIRFRCTHKYSDLPYNSIRKQYFGNNFFTYKEGQEVFVDCGAFDGDSVHAFKTKMKKLHINNYQIVAFEPDAKVLKILRENHPDIVTIAACVWEKSDVLSLIDNDPGASWVESVENTGSSSKSRTMVTKVKACSIDETPACENATFIKMDVEGSEYRALLGAQKTILKNHPKLAICIYHSDLDMIRLIKLVHEMVPQYKLYVRQHNNCIYDTVLYATV